GATRPSGRRPSMRGGTRSSIWIATRRSRRCGARRRPSARSSTATGVPASASSAPYPFDGHVARVAHDVAAVDDAVGGDLERLVLAVVGLYDDALDWLAVPWLEAECAQLRGVEQRIRRHHLRAAAEQLVAEWEGAAERG